LRQDDHKLIGFGPADRIPQPQGGAKPSRHFPQNRIPGEWAEGGIDVPEEVNIRDHQVRERIAMG